MFLFRTQANELALLISRMQLNADQVEKNILQSEERLALVGTPDCRVPLSRLPLLLLLKDNEILATIISSCVDLYFSALKL